MKLNIEINAIYRHYKGDLYKVTGVGTWEKTGEPFVIYHKSDINGIFISIRKVGPLGDENDKEIVLQPFLRDLDEFNEMVFPLDENLVTGVGVKRFTFIKQL